MNIPNFFLIGAAKAGTTSVYHYLDMHPDVFMSRIKEPNHFATEILAAAIRQDLKRALDANLRLFQSSGGSRRTHIALVQDREEYLQLFRDAGSAKIIGECSVSYLPSPLAATNIHRFNPDARILILLRNPVYRAFSHYKMDLKIGSINIPFLQAIDEDLAHGGASWGVYRNYVWNGMYAEQVRRYFETFPEDQIAVMMYDELKTDSRQVMERIFSFLRLSFDDGVSTEHRFNRSLQPRFETVNRFLQLQNLKPYIKRVLPELLFRKLKRMYYSDEKAPVLSREAFHEVLSVFRSDIEALQKILNMDLSKWLEPDAE